jgi:two-component system chemotaxis response regulator CheB
MIVDDSLFIRAILRQIINSAPNNKFEVVAAATDVDDAIRKMKYMQIDVITLDIEMPGKNGLMVLKEIMENDPKPVVMLSSLTKSGAKETIDALSLGAIDFITKPSTETDLTTLKQEIYQKLETAANSNHKKITSGLPKKIIVAPTVPKKQTDGKLNNLLVIGCSTGGPNALRKLAAQLPKNLPVGILIVQHMPEGSYISSLAANLNQISHFEAMEATDGMEITDGKIIIAPGGYHMELVKRGGRYQVVTNQKEPVGGLRPSVDILFESIARNNIEVPILAAILTGMGSDGLNGTRELKKINAKVIAESQNTSVVYGMPKKIVENNLADYVEDLGMIVPRIVKIII